MNWIEIYSRSHRGKTIPQILLIDPGWFFWMMDSNKFKGQSLAQAQDVLKKARRIKIPARHGPDFQVGYRFDRKGKFRGLELIERTVPPHDGSSRLVRTQHIDFEQLRLQRSEDKTGYGLLLKGAKYILFGDRSHKMMKRRCEEFFSNSDNFDL